ncbi:hypothetical protein C0J52_28214 [Blattella germanica]|nr:hypothetical protein C0J52_28214 [Blattella germanica]
MSAHTVAQLIKAKCFGTSPRDARWFQSSWGRHYTYSMYHGFHQFKVPVPTQNREETGELRHVTYFGYGD